MSLDIFTAIYDRPAPHVGVPEHPDHHPMGCVHFDTEGTEFEGHVISFHLSCFLEG